MNLDKNYKSEEFNLADSIVGEEIDLHEKDKSTKRAKKIDRSSNKYSEEAFRNLPREEQLRLATIHWMDSRGYDDSKMFQFSYTHFSNICKELGFAKGVLDVREEKDIRKSENADAVASSVIYIDHGRRKKTEIKKLTLAKTTVDKIDQLIEDRLSNIEKSKVIDEILSSALDQYLFAKKEGRFGVAYRKTEEERII